LRSPRFASEVIATRDRSTPQPLQIWAGLASVLWGGVAPGIQSVVPKDFASAGVFLYRNETTRERKMKTSSLLATGLLSLVCVTAPGQPAAPLMPPPPVRVPSPYVQTGTAEKGNELTRFDLDFTGGTPAELVAAIEKAMSKPLNVIVPDEFAMQKIPALKMRHVDVSQLFQAIEQASAETVTVTVPPYAPQQYQTSYGFRAKASPLSDDSIWCFTVQKPILPPSQAPASSKVCRFYALAPYLERQIAVDDGATGSQPDGKKAGTMRHLTVDDITTAIEIGWRMMGKNPGPATMAGQNSGPVIKFHKDTKLLIAVGDPAELEIIGAVLRALDNLPALPPRADAVGANKAAAGFARRYGLPGVTSASDPAPTPEPGQGQ
jgi:hypothetical protein